MNGSWFLTRATVRVSVPSADVNLGCIDSHGRARRRGPAEFILDGAQTDSLVCVPDAAIDIGYARALVTRPEALGTGDSNPEVLRPYTRLSALRLRASSSRAAGHLLRSSLLPSLELLTLYSHYDDNGGGEEEKGQRLAESSAPEPSTSAAMGGSVGAADVPPDFLAFQGLRELTIDEGGDYQYGLRGDVRDALPALSGLRRLSMHSAYHCPQGLAQLQHLEDLSVTVRSGGGDSLGAWDLRGLRGLRRAVFQGRSFGGLTHLPRMDASLAALERLCLVDVQVSLRTTEAARGSPASDQAGAQQSQQQEHATAGTAAAAADVQLNPLHDLFEVWVAPCGVLPSIRTVEVWYPFFTSSGSALTGQLGLDPGAGGGGWFQGGDGARWRARLWAYKGEGEYGELEGPCVLHVVSGVPVDGVQGESACRLWLKLAFERVY
eukprot:XP_001690559.1 predicted protein [Chlamydomonas reinhardtii]